MKFIRLDYDRNFLGTKHRSSFGDNYEDSHWEEGISCYEINKESIFDSIEDLYKYWTNVATEYDFTNYQVTIFDGVRVWDGKQKAYGSDYEDLAECTNNDTIVKLDGELFNQVKDLFEMNQNYKDGFTDEDDDPWINDEELETKITEMFIKYL